MVVVVAVVVVGVVGRVVGGVGVVVVAETRRKALGGGQTLGRLLLAVAGTLAFAIVVSRTCGGLGVRMGVDSVLSRPWETEGW